MNAVLSQHAYGHSHMATHLSPPSAFNSGWPTIVDRLFFVSLLGYARSGMRSWLPSFLCRRELSFFHLSNSNRSCMSLHSR